MKKRFVKTTVVAIIALSALQLSATAYNLAGAKWSSSSITYTIDSSCSTDSEDAWVYAADEWNAAARTTLREVSSGGKVTCSEDYDRSVGWDGITRAMGSGNTITSCDAIVNSYYTEDYSTRKLRSVTGHEFGHVWGLAEAGKSSRVLMNPETERRYTSYGIYTPQDDDIDGVNSIYF